jgi:hypothetical protein
MKRRTFLAAVGATAAVAWWPRLIRRAFADASFDAPGARKTAPGLASARTRARQANKPLFVIVVPADDGKKYTRGYLWGEYLNHGSAADLAPLVATEVACATMDELASLAPDVKGEPLAVLVAPDGQTRALDARVPEYPRDGRWNPEADDAITNRRIHALATMVRDALPAVPATEVRAAADQVIRAVRRAPPSGSRWANASACGPASVEGVKDDERIGYGCGMGHIPSKSSRFLYFFAKTPQQLELEWAAAQAKKAKK